ncbi:hypothetical protein CJ195_25715 [Bacillus sp. UMB0899]|nr:hypothetical protein CJ195_25715 [Bacillus sp. UMB0899]
MYKQRLNKLLMITCLTFLLPAIVQTSDSGIPSRTVQASAPQNYFHAHQYNSTDKGDMMVSENATKTEPPRSYSPVGEREFSKEKYQSLRSMYTSENETYSQVEFPYHRFDVKVHRNVKPSDKITLYWKGKSLPGRQVTMYGWNVLEEKWVEIEGVVAGDTPIELKGTVNVEDFVQNRKVSVIVQDQLSQKSKSYDYSFVWMSDTQYYSQDYPAVFKSITEWIAENRDVMNIKYVFHTGDIVNRGNDDRQWKRASAYMNTLDVARIPYGVLPGNHDEGHDFQHYKAYFGEQRFKKKSYYGGSFEQNRGHYDLISVNGKDYIFVYMGWGIGKKEIEWLNEVLERYPDRTAILSFHEYLKKNGDRSRKGNEIYEKVVKPNSNVVAVLCGHYHSSRLAVDELDDDGNGTVDRKVYQILADYQKGPEGGSGFVRLLHVDEETNTIDVRTYSPYTNKYHYYNPDKHPKKEQFTMDINVEKTNKMISTTYFELNIYKQVSTQKVAAGSMP